MLQEGSYVCMTIAPETRRGTVHEATNHKGTSQFMFRLDRRFSDHLDDFFIDDGDVEECVRPTDAEIERINYLAALGR